MPLVATQSMRSHGNPSNHLGVTGNNGPRTIREAYTIKTLSMYTSKHQLKRKRKLTKKDRGSDCHVWQYLQKYTNQILSRWVYTCKHTNNYL